MTINNQIRTKFKKGTDVKMYRSIYDTEMLYIRHKRIQENIRKVYGLSRQHYNINKKRLINKGILPELKK